MSPEAVLKLYPQAVPLNREHLGATPVFSPFVKRQKLSGQTLSGLANPVTVELRYWKDQLWVVVVYFGENSKEEVLAYLEKEYGPPRSKPPGRAYWGRANADVAYSEAQRWYAVSDRVLSKEAQQALAQDLQKRGGAVTPAATPAT